MFESIGRDPDHDAGRRQRLAASLGLGSLALGAGLVVGLLAWLATPPVVAREVLVERFPEAEPDGPEEQPPAPPAPAPAAPRGTLKPSDLDPDAPVATPRPVSPAGGGGDSPNAEGTGRCTGPGCGPSTGGGGQGGAPDGEGTGAGREPHDPPVLRRMVDPVYPKAARQADLGDQRCLARVKIDERGVPYDVAVEVCPLAFHEATRAAILTWRWEPARRGKERVASQVTVGVTYRVR